MKDITNEKIIFSDDYAISFDECVENWKQKIGNKESNTRCVAERNITANPPFFIFSTSDITKIVFTGILRKKHFIKLQAKLQSLGYTTYDLS